MSAWLQVMVHLKNCSKTDPAAAAISLAATLRLLQPLCDVPPQPPRQGLTDHLDASPFRAVFLCRLVLLDDRSVQHRTDLHTIKDVAVCMMSTSHGAKQTWLHLKQYLKRYIYCKTHGR